MKGVTDNKDMTRTVMMDRRSDGDNDNVQVEGHDHDVEGDIYHDG